MYQSNQVVTVIPARDEALSIAQVINNIKAIRNDDTSAVIDRILVCDNASTDDTAEIARALGAEVVFEPQPGYGAACLKALGLIEDADIEDTDIVLFIDADASLKINESLLLLAAIDDGQDLVIGCRLKNLREHGSMSRIQIFGNSLASFLIRCLWQVKVNDLGPFRAIRFSALQKLNMQDRHYGWTVEMQVKAIQHNLKMSEIPVHYYRRIGQSKISGTLTGIIGAGCGIIITIFKLAWNRPKSKLGC